MRYFYKIGNVTIFASQCACNGMATNKDGEIESASFTDDTVIKVLKPGDVFPRIIKEEK